jgi:hypothetical protein
MQPESSKPAAVTAIANFSDVSFIDILDSIRKRFTRKAGFLPRHDSTFTSHIIAEIDKNSSAGFVILHCDRPPVSFLPQVLE